MLRKLMEYNLTELEQVSLRKTHGQIPEFEPIYTIEAQSKNVFNIEREQEPDVLFWFNFKQPFTHSNKG